MKNLHPRHRTCATKFQPRAPPWPQEDEVALELRYCQRFSQCFWRITNHPTDKIQGPKHEEVYATKVRRPMPWCPNRGNGRECRVRRYFGNACDEPRESLGYRRQRGQPKGVQKPKLGSRTRTP